jgi:hypothetical protein
VKQTDLFETPRPLDAHIWPRAKNDNYVEPPWCSERLFAEEPFEGSVHDRACGSGRIVRSALQAGLQAYGSDLIDHGYGFPQQDFLTCCSEHDNVVTNVPFKIFRPFAEHALKLVRHKVAMLLPLARLNAAGWLQDTPLARVWLLSPRPSIPPGHYIKAGKKPGGGKVDFCWLVWERGYAGKPEMCWLHRDGCTPSAEAAE